MTVIGSIQRAQDGAAALNAQGHHVDGDAIVVMSDLATLHRRLDDKFRMGRDPLLTALIAIVHRGKGNNILPSMQFLQLIFPGAGQIVPVLRAGSP